MWWSSSPLLLKTEWWVVGKRNFPDSVWIHHWNLGAHWILGFVVQWLYQSPLALWRRERDMYLSQWWEQEEGIWLAHVGSRKFQQRLKVLVLVQGLHSWSAPSQSIVMQSFTVDSDTVVPGVANACQPLGFVIPELFLNNNQIPIIWWWQFGWSSRLWQNADTSE